MVFTGFQTKKTVSVSGARSVGVILKDIYFSFLIKQKRARPVPKSRHKDINVADIMPEYKARCLECNELETDMWEE